MTLGTEDRLNELFQKYVDKNITKEEYAELFMYIRNPENAEQLFAFMDEHNKDVKSNATVHEIDWDTMYRNITQEKIVKQKVFPIRRILGLAAMVTLIVGGYLHLKQGQSATVKHKLVFKNDIKPVTDKATLTLANGQVINLTDSLKDAMVVGSGISIKKGADGLISYVVDQKHIGTSNGTHTLSTPHGGMFSLVLAEGSKVWLNAGSSITFPEVFDAAERRVKLIGEAYFEVSKDKARPFYVNTGKSEVKVLGTHFNVMAYPDDFRSALSLFEGSVQLSNANHKNILKPGKQVQFTESSSIGEFNANQDEILSWKNNLFVFNATSLHEVMKTVTRWYNVKIRYEGEIPEMSFTGEIPRTANVSKVLKALELTGDVSFGIDGNVIICRKKETETE